jgi:ABC-type glycerol-3-phosphate transport system permease component
MPVGPKRALAPTLRHLPHDPIGPAPDDAARTFLKKQAHDASIPFLRIMLNTIEVAVVLTVLTVVLSVCAAYALVLWDFPGKGIVFVLFAGSLLIPFQVTMIPNSLMVARLGWLNSMPGLIVPQLGSTIGVALGVFCCASTS